MWREGETKKSARERKEKRRNFYIVQIAKKPNTRRNIIGWPWSLAQVFKGFWTYGKSV